MSPAWRPAGKEAEMSTPLINHLHIPTGMPNLAPSSMEACFECLVAVDATSHAHQLPYSAE